MSKKYSESEIVQITLNEMKFKFELIDRALKSDEKQLKIYVLGGAGALLAGYFSRYTRDIDYIDINYQAWQGRYLDLIGTQTDILEFSHTTVPKTYPKRARNVFDGLYLKVFVLSKEDIIISKLCRYSEKDKNDIGILMQSADKTTLMSLLDEVEKDICNRITRIREKYLKNLKIFIEDYSLNRKD